MVIVSIVMCLCILDGGTCFCAVSIERQERVIEGEGGRGERETDGGRER